MGPSAGIVPPLARSFDLSQSRFLFSISYVRIWTFYSTSNSLLHAAKIRYLRVNVEEWRWKFVFMRSFIFFFSMYALRHTSPIFISSCINSVFIFRAWKYSKIQFVRRDVVEYVAFWYGPRRCDQKQYLRMNCKFLIKYKSNRIMNNQLKCIHFETHTRTDLIEK